VFDAPHPTYEEVLVRQALAQFALRDLLRQIVAILKSAIPLQQALLLRLDIDLSVDPQRIAFQVLRPRVQLKLVETSRSESSAEDSHSPEADLAARAKNKES